MVKNPLCKQAGDAGDADSTSGLGRSLEEEVATRSIILAWKIPWTDSLVSAADGVTKCWTVLSMHTDRQTCFRVVLVKL